jgi:hypothetical protein
MFLMLTYLLFRRGAGLPVIEYHSEIRNEALMINTLHSQTERRSTTVAEGKSVRLLDRVKRLITRLFSTSREELQGESMLADRRCLLSDVEHRVKGRDF